MAFDPTATIKAEYLQALASGDSERLRKCEHMLLESNHTRLLVASYVRYHRGIENCTGFVPKHVPGALKRIAIPKNGGSGIRVVYSPNDHDYIMAAYYHIALGRPILASRAHYDTHGFVPEKGTTTATRAMIHAVGSECLDSILQIDINNCFPTAPVDLIREDSLKETLLINYVNMVRQRGAEAAGRSGQLLRSGLPQGHPIAPDIVTLVIDKLLEDIRSRWHGKARIVVYADDITILAPDLQKVTRIKAEIVETIGRYGMKLKESKTRFTDARKESRMNFLGYEIDWSPGTGNPLIRPQERAYARLTDKVAAANTEKEIRQIRHGWVNAYQCSNDPSMDARMKAAIEAGRAAKQNHP